MVMNWLFGRQPADADRPSSPPAGQPTEVPDSPAALAAELALLAGWQGLSAVQVLPRGDLAPALQSALPG